MLNGILLNANSYSQKNSIYTKNYSQKNSIYTKNIVSDRLLVVM